MPRELRGPVTKHKMCNLTVSLLVTKRICHGDLMPPILDLVLTWRHCSHKHAWLESVRFPLITSRDTELPLPPSIKRSPDSSNYEKVLNTGRTHTAVRRCPLVLSRRWDSVSSWRARTAPRWGWSSHVTSAYWDMLWFMPARRMCPSPARTSPSRAGRLSSLTC